MSSIRRVGSRYFTLWLNRFVGRLGLKWGSTPEQTRIDLLWDGCREPIERTKELMKRLIPGPVQPLCLYSRRRKETKPDTLVINYLTKRIYVKDS